MKAAAKTIGDETEKAVERARARGQKVGSIHLRFVNPLPSDLPAVFGRFKRYLVPELNNGQLVRLLRAEYLLPFASLAKIEGMPFKASEIEAAIDEQLGATNGTLHHD